MVKQSSRFSASQAYQNLEFPVLWSQEQIIWPSRRILLKPGGFDVPEGVRYISPPICLVMRWWWTILYHVYNILAFFGEAMIFLLNQRWISLSLFQIQLMFALPFYLGNNIIKTQIFLHYMPFFHCLLLFFYLSFLLSFLNQAGLRVGVFSFRRWPINQKTKAWSQLLEKGMMKFISGYLALCYSLLKKMQNYYAFWLIQISDTICTCNFNK